MSKFRVSVHGKNFQLGSVKKRFFRNEFSRRSVGFYTTRFVEAETANEAIDTVFALLRLELESDGSVTRESSIELEEIREDEEGFDMHAPGEGYTFYGDADESTNVGASS